MSLLDVVTEGAQELELLEDGLEVTVRIVNLEVVPVKSRPGSSQLSVRFDVPSNPLADDMYGYVSLPDAALKESDPKAFSKAVGRFKDFCKCFSVDSSGPIDSDDFKGMTGDVIVGLEDDPQYGRRNRIKQYVVGA